jgi:hypothetical protein
MTAGRNFSDWRSETVTEALRVYALRAFELRQQHGQALENFNKALRQHFYSSADKLPSTEAELSNMLSKPLPPACVSSEPARQLLAVAAQAGIIKSATQDIHRLAAMSTRRSLQNSVDLLTHRWLEVAVLDRMLKLAHFKQVHWALSSAKSTDADAPGHGILSLDTQFGGLRYVECIAALNIAPQEQLEQTVARAQQLAGNHISVTLVFFRAQQEQVLKQSGKRLGVEVLIGPEEIVKRFMAKSSTAQIS